MTSPLSDVLDRNQFSRNRPITGSSLFTVFPPSCGPMTISLSSSLLFSPDISFAYKAKNRLFWLNFGTWAPKTGLGVGSDALDFPFPLGVEAGWLVLGKVVVKRPESNVSGRKTAAHRSYSRQSKSDLARRYWFISFASRAASSGSTFPVTTIGGCPFGGTSVIWESSDSDISSLDGIDVRSSAALYQD
jgi:hypothetical protein